jgi:hypothetical protein
MKCLFGPCLHLRSCTVGTVSIRAILFGHLITFCMHNAEILSGYCHNKERKSQKPRGLITVNMFLGFSRDLTQCRFQFNSIPISVLWVVYHKKKHCRLYLSLANAALLDPTSIINLTRIHRFIPEFSRLRGFAAWQPVRP